MYQELYQILIQHKQLPLPGIGTFLVEKNSAIGDFSNRKIDPSAYTTALRTAVNSPSKKLFTELANALNISDRDAIIRFNDFVFDLKKQISAGDVINWDGVGSLSTGLVGEIKFTPVVKQLFFDQPVIAVKVIREKAEHTVRVGEDERTSTQMTELLNQPAKKRLYWWAFAVIATLLAVMFIGWYLSEHGFNVSSTANQKKLEPIEEPTATHKTLQ
jgi:nucleoid DNA-binding protein